VIFGRRRPDPSSRQGLLIRWLEWVATAEVPQCPVRDQDGRYGMLRQPDDVFFLAGNFGGLTRRKVTAPTGTPIHVPGLVYWNAFEGAAWLPEGAYAAVFLDDAPIPLDHVELDPLAVIRGTEGNPVTEGTGRTKVAAAALTGTFTPEPGRHEVVVEGRAGAGFSLQVTYQLDVH